MLRRVDDAHALHDARPTHITDRHAFEDAMAKLRANRFFVPEQVVITKRVGKRTQKKKQWRLETSIWAPRVQWCDSKYFWDTEPCSRAMFECDWTRTIASGLVAFIEKHDDGEDNLGAGDSMAIEAESEVDQVKEVLWSHHELLYNIFTMYCAIGTSDDKFHIMFNSFSEMVNDFGLVDRSSVHCNKAAWDGLFIAVDASSKKAKAAANAGVGGDFGGGSSLGGGGGMGADKGGKSKALDREEYIQCMVKAAIMKFVQSRNSKISDISSAVEALFTQCLLPRCDAGLLTTPNDFRNVIYIEEVDIVLRRHEDALRQLYAHTCALGKSNNSFASKCISFPAWRMLVKLLELLGTDLTERDATLCFVFSRMHVIDGEKDNKSRVKRTNLGFEDFLEGICRLATLKALPTDEEIEEAVSGNAATHLLQMAKVDPNAHEALLRQRAAPFGELPTLQPLHRCVEHFCHIMIVYCQGGLERNPKSDMRLTKRQLTWAFNTDRITFRNS